MLAAAKGCQMDEFEGRQREVFSIYQRLNQANKHKMNPIPVCLIPEAFR
jgi:NAD+ synthase